MPFAGLSALVGVEGAMKVPSLLARILRAPCPFKKGAVVRRNYHLIGNVLKRLSVLTVRPNSSRDAVVGCSGTIRRGKNHERNEPCIMCSACALLVYLGACRVPSQKQNTIIVPDNMPTSCHHLPIRLACHAHNMSSNYRDTLYKIISKK